MPARPRVTAQRQAIAAQLSKLDGFVSAQQLHDILSSTGQSIGLATVYRNLQLLAEEGSVDVVRTDSELLYRHCDTSEHHHHLVCRFCGKAVEVAGNELENWVRKIIKETGFIDIDHTVEFMGTCADCALQQKNLTADQVPSVSSRSSHSSASSHTHSSQA